MDMTWKDFYELKDELVPKINRRSVQRLKNGRRDYIAVYGVPRGGIPLAMEISRACNIPMLNHMESNFNSRDVLVCDDIIDSGATRDKFPDNDFVALVHKPSYVKSKECLGEYYDQIGIITDSDVWTLTVKQADDWVSFPWESTKQEDGEDIVRRMLEYIGEDPNRPGLIDTPRRVVKMWDEVFRGYKESPPEIMVVKNGEDGINYDEMIRDEGYFYSFCEHHIVSFLGRYQFAYVPDQLVMGASKIGRTINYYSAKLQIAERLVHQIADRIEEVVKPKGLMLIMDARHLCKEMRGLRMYDSPFGVDVVRGVFRDKNQTYKSEFLSWVGNSKRG